MPNRKHRLSDEDKIVVLKKTNPFQKGSNRWKRAQVILTSAGKPWEQARRRDADSWTLHQLERRKLVRIAAA